MGELNSDDHCINYCGQESHRRNGGEIIINKRILICTTWVQPPKRQNDLGSFQGKPLSMTVIQVYAPTTDAKEAEADQSYEDLENLLELAPKRDALFISGDWCAKEGSQEIPRVTGKLGLGEQNEAGQRLTEFCQENAFVRANTLSKQHKRWVYSLTSPNGQY